MSDQYRKQTVKNTEGLFDRSSAIEVPKNQLCFKSDNKFRESRMHTGRYSKRWFITRPSIGWTDGDKRISLVYLGVRVDFMRWDKELEDGVLLNWCSGVVRGPSMLTERTQHTTFGMKRWQAAAQTAAPAPLPSDKRSLASAHFSRGWRSSWSSRWSGDRRRAARSLPSQTGSSSPLAETADAPQPGHNNSGRSSQRPGFQLWGDTMVYCWQHLKNK